MGLIENTSLEDRLNEERNILAHAIRRIAKLESEAKPPIVQEIVLARRDAENSRMRLGVALGYAKGNDPLEPQ